MRKISEYELPRNAVYIMAILVGCLAGVANIFLDIDLTMRPALVGWLVLSIVIVIVMHEGIHGLTAALFGHKPIFGVKPPLVFVTFGSKIPRGHFMIVAIAPLVVLDLLFGFMYYGGVLKLFSDFCFTINTLGAVGDLWIVFKLLGTERGTLIQDTKTGIEVWKDEPEPKDA